MNVLLYTISFVASYCDVSNRYGATGFIWNSVFATREIFTELVAQFLVSTNS